MKFPTRRQVSLSVTPLVAKTADRFGKMAVVFPGAVLCLGFRVT